MFVGAGVSVAAGIEVGSKVPDWSALLRKLSAQLSMKREREFVGKLINKKQFLDAAQIIRDGIASSDFVAAIRDEIPGTLRKPSSIYELILKIDPKVILTTNYDEFLEQQFLHFSGGNRSHSVAKYTQQHMLDEIRSPMRVIGKIHGCITEPSEIILTRRSYFDARRNHPTFYAIVESLITVNTALFLGYSFSDPDVSLILENANLRTPSKHQHYALVPRFEHRSLRDALSSAHNIKFVEYPSGEHDNFVGALKELCDGVSQYRLEKSIV